MSLNLFLKRAIDPDAGVDLEDSARTKLALKARGYLDAADGGLDEYPDLAMYDGIRKFQEDHGLAVDGVMKPGGPTEKELALSFGPRPWTLTPEPPTRECAGQWVSAGKECVGPVCVYFWQCLEKPVGGKRK